MKKKGGKQVLLNAISARLDATPTSTPCNVNYADMEPLLRKIERRLSLDRLNGPAYPPRWMAVKLMEGDKDAVDLARRTHEDAGHIIDLVQEYRGSFEEQSGEAPELYIGRSRLRFADSVAGWCVTRSASPEYPLSERIDRIVCNRIAGPAILIGVMYLLYYFSIVQGYKLTSFTWPILAWFRSMMETLTPRPGFLEIPLARSFLLWLVDSMNALLNYVPIFFILFALIAILEDSGYMPRMAFIMDRILHRFGLHGQSILPMVLGGIYVGGSAVPAVMACKGIPTNRSAWHGLTIPCQLLAKGPLYIPSSTRTLPAQGVAMFFISTGAFSRTL
jgi:ferrous iron transport protein B